MQQGFCIHVKHNIKQAKGAQLKLSFLFSFCNSFRAYSGLRLLKKPRSNIVCFRPFPFALSFIPTAMVQLTCLHVGVASMKLNFVLLTSSMLLSVNTIILSFKDANTN